MVVGVKQMEIDGNVLEVDSVDLLIGHGDNRRMSCCE